MCAIACRKERTYSETTPDETLSRHTFLVGRLLLAASSTFDAHSVPLEIMVEDAAAPQSQNDGTGYANDVVRAAFDAEGIAVKLLVVPYARCKDSAMAGRVAACFSMSWEQQFADTVAFAEKPLFTVYPRYYRRATTRAIQAERDIPKGAVIGLVNGYEYPESLARLREKGVVFQYANSEAANLRKLSTGRIDFAVLMLTDIKTEATPMKEAGVRNVVYAFQGDAIGSYIGFSRRHLQGKHAHALFNRGHAAILTNGTLRLINKKWAQRPDQ